MGEFSLSHILLLMLILIVFFGPSRLPALGQSLGKAIRGFKEGLNQPTETQAQQLDTAKKEQLNSPQS